MKNGPGQIGEKTMTAVAHHQAGALWCARRGVDALNGGEGFLGTRQRKTGVVAPGDDDQPARGDQPGDVAGVKVIQKTGQIMGL